MQEEQYNQIQLQKLQSSIFTVKAHHYFISSDQNALGEVPDEFNPSSDSDTGGFNRNIEIVIGARIMLTRNINTDEGLVNGAVGIITSIEFSTPDMSFPSVIFIKFDKPSIGKVTCKGENRIQSPISIFPIEHKFLYAGGEIVRKQYSIILAWACTIHKVQGLSLDRAVVDIGITIFDYGMAYVALNRVRSISGLILSWLDTHKIKASDSGIEEYERQTKRH